MIPSIDKMLGDQYIYLKWGENSTFRHVVGNLYNIAQNFDYLNESHEAGKAMESLKKYLLLIKMYPLFRDQQVQRDTFPHGRMTITEYIDMEYKKLLWSQ